MSEWDEGEPPVGIEIEYERDGRTIERGTLDHAGKFGIGPGRQAPKLRNHFRRERISEMFEVTRWRKVEEE